LPGIMLLPATSPLARQIYLVEAGGGAGEHKPHVLPQPVEVHGRSPEDSAEEQGIRQKPHRPERVGRLEAEALERCDAVVFATGRAAYRLADEAKGPGSTRRYAVWWPA